MTVAELLEQALRLSVAERKALAKGLIDSFNGSSAASKAPKTLGEILDKLATREPIELIYPEIEDPVAWVQALRQEEEDRLAAYWTEDML